MRRGLGRPLGRGMEPAVPPLLRRANQLLSSGDPAGAASAFEQLARAAEARGGPRAPFFHIQAGRARLTAGQKAESVESLERGLGLLAVRGQTGKLSAFGERIVQELTQRGFVDEARKITDYLKNLNPNYQPASPGSASTGHPALPTHCPGCGAAVHPDEVEWLDQITAECAYCGTPVRGS